LLAPAFYWEDVVSFVVLALHTAYLCSLFTTVLEPRQQMFLALTAYATYAVNATQFVLKLRAARLGAKAEDENRARMPAPATHVNASEAGLPVLSASASGPLA
jgi:3-vinyl bacteriochlorophyllide hydratase